MTFFLGGEVSGTVMNRALCETTFFFSDTLSRRRTVIPWPAGCMGFIFPWDCPVHPLSPHMPYASPICIFFNNYQLTWFSVLRPDLVHFWQTPCINSGDTWLPKHEMQISGNSQMEYRLPGIASNACVKSGSVISVLCCACFHTALYWAKRAFILQHAIKKPSKNVYNLK